MSQPMYLFNIPNPLSILLLFGIAVGLKIYLTYGTKLLMQCLINRDPVSVQLRDIEANIKSLQATTKRMLATTEFVALSKLKRELVALEIQRDKLGK